jgi:AcrR family transcriptional regulator
MVLNISLNISNSLYLKNPVETELGRKILSESLSLIHELGLETFTFKKLSDRCKTTEASIYRYFKDKHQLLHYFNAWYWRYLIFAIQYETSHLKTPKQKLKVLIEVLSNPFEIKFNSEVINIKLLYEIIISESIKVYFTKQVDKEQKNGSYNDYHELCLEIVSLIAEYQPKVKFPHALVVTLVESAHLQQFFMEHLNTITDLPKNNNKQLQLFLEKLLFNYLEL